MQTETASLQETISLHGLTCPAPLPGDCRTVAVGGPHIWVCTGSLSRGSKDIQSESRARAVCTFPSLAQSSPPCRSSLLGGAGALSSPGLPGPSHSSISYLQALTALQPCALQGCATSSKIAGVHFATKIKSSQKHGMANFLALRLVQHLESRGDDFLKTAVSFWLSQPMWGT